jgi:hypothetical protein
MAESTNSRTLARQVEKLAGRLDKLERSFRAGPPPAEPAGAGEAPLLFCSLPEVRERELGPDVSPYRERLIRYLEKKWVNGTTLHYYFFNSGPWSGPESQVELVRDGFEVWRDVGIGIGFEEVDSIADAEIRIGFLQGDGAWSYVGRDVIDVPGQHERTMNFGWDLTQDPRGVDVPVHEIGHTLGFPHEHQNPFAGIVWDEPAVYAYFGGPPNNWPQQTTYHNILRKLPAAEVEGTEWDPDSVMHYSFPAGLILQPPQYSAGLRPAGGLSQLDIAEVRRFYPPIRNTGYPKLEPFHSQLLSIGRGEQRNFTIEPPETREYTIGTFGRSDTVIVLFEDRDGDLKYLDGDDDSGFDRNARITEWLEAGKRYVLRVRLYLNWATGDTAVMLW